MNGRMYLDQCVLAQQEYQRLYKSGDLVSFGLGYVQVKASLFDEIFPEGPERSEPNGMYRQDYGTYKGLTITALRKEEQA